VKCGLFGLLNNSQLQGRVVKFDLFCLLKKSQSRVTVKCSLLRIQINIAVWGYCEMWLNWFIKQLQSRVVKFDLFGLFKKLQSRVTVKCSSFSS